MIYNPNVRDRTNRGLLVYSQKMADVIGIFWEFHKKRIELGEQDFSKGFGENVDYGQVIERHRYGGTDPVDIINIYSGGIQISFQESMGHFFNGIRSKSIRDISTDTRPFFLDYTRNLLDETQRMGSLYSGFARGENYSVHRTVEAGAETGSTVVPQIDAIFGDSLKTVYPLILAKVELRHNQRVQSQVGLRTVDNGRILEPDFNLLDPKHGINRQQLSKFGYGEAVGCPVAMPVTPRTKEFLRDECNTIPTSPTMLEDFAKVVHEDMAVKVRSWYSLLAPDLAKEVVDQRNRDLLDGRIWETVQGVNPLPRSRCPYSKEG